jgi:signal transduction histidine kinase
MTNEQTIDVLIVDDDPDHVFLARTAFERDPRWVVDSAPTVAAARERLAARNFAVVVADYRLPDGDGLELIEDVQPHGLVIVMTAQGSERVAVDALQRGAYDYVVKDAGFPDSLPDVIDRALAKYRAETEGAERQRHVQLENRKLSEVNQRLKALDVAKSEFLSTASHELRTPLAIVREFIAIMRDGLAGPVTPEQRECLDSALNNCDRLESLVNDILDLQKIESGRVRLRRRRLDLKPLIKECYHDFLPRFSAREQLLELVVSDGLPHVLGDEGRISQVLFNLVGNANRHTPGGSRVRITAHRRAERVIVAVEDNGPGIPAEEQGLVFEKFVQLNRQPGAGARGTGLGLAIAKNILDLHEGDIWLRSTPREGSTFFFALPTYDEGRAVRALVKDRLIVAETSGEHITLALLRLDPPRPTDVARPPEGAASHPATRGRAPEARLTLARAQELAEAQLRRRDDEVFAAEEEQLLVMLTASDESGEDAIVARVVQAVLGAAGPTARFSWSSVSITPGIEPEEWITIAKERLSPAVAHAGDPAASAA